MRTNARGLLALAAAAGSCLSVSTANAQLVIGNDQTATASRNIWMVDVTGVRPPRALVTGTQAEVWAMAADDAGRMLYWTNGTRLFKAAYDQVNPLVVQDVGAVGFAITGLAWDSAAGQLVGRASGGFYTINTSTGAGTLAFAITAQDFGGLDYDPVTDAFYGLNDSTTTTVIPGGRGVYRINKPITSPTFTEILSEYPNRLDTGALDTDIDGLAVGNGKLYMVNDVPAQGVYVYNLTTNAYEAGIVPTPFTATTGIFSGGAWAPGMFTPPTGADVAVTKTATPGTLVVPPSGNITYTITVRNNGPEEATGVAMSDTLPAGLSFVSVDNGATFNNGVVSANIGNLANGAQQVYTLVVNTGTVGSYANTATITSTSQDNNSGNNAATSTTTVRNPLADVRATVTDPADCAVSVGGTVSYTVTFDNLGPEAAESARLTITLPSGATFQSSIPALTPSGNQLVLDLGTVNSGGGGSVIINMTADVTGVLQLDAIASTTTNDPTSTNNSVTALTQIQGPPPATAEVKGVLSTIASSSSSLVPGGGGLRFATGITAGRPYRSPDGSRWIIAMDTDNAITAQDQVLMVSDSGGLHIAVQEGLTNLPTAQGSEPNPPPYQLAGSFDAVYGINDAGQFVFSGIDNRTGTADDGFVVRGNADGSFTLVAQELITEAPAITGGSTYGSTRGSAHVDNLGRVSVLHQINGLTTATDEFVLGRDGTQVISQETVTVFGNSGGRAINDVLNGSQQTGVSWNADSSRYILQGTLTGATTSDSVVIVDGNVVLQEGSPIPSSPITDNISTFVGTRMETDGTWFARGTTTNADNDWVVRNGETIARGLTPIFSGSTELYDDATFASLFYMMLGNNRGDYVIGGVTDAPNALANAVLVLNNTTVLMRENDPVDLDNNGAFDDDGYVRTFIDDRAFMTDSELYVVVRLRSGAAANCGATDTDLGQALVRIALPPACNPDINGDGNVDQGDVDCMISTAAGDPSCLRTDVTVNIDLNNDGNVDQGDVDVLIDIVAGAPCPS